MNSVGHHDQQSLWRDIGWVIGAHVTMLRDRDVIDDDLLAVLQTAIEAAGRGAPPGVSTLNGLIAAYDERIEAVTPAAIAGVAALGRARTDVASALVRLALRRGLLDLGQALNALRQALIDLASAHVTSLMPGLSAGQPVQPTTFGHFLGGAIGPLGRAAIRLRTAYGVVNLSPLGALALASSGLPVDRERVAALLGFDGPLLNTFDAVAATDHLTVSAEAAAAVTAPMRRLGDELLTWLRTDPESFQLTGDWAVGETDPYLPQFRPPAALQRLVRDAERIDAQAATVARLARAVPYGPLGVDQDDILTAGLALLEDSAGLIRRGTTLLSEGLAVNRAYLANRAGRAYTTVSDLTSFLITEETLEPAAARAIAALTIRRAIEERIETSAITPDMLDAAALLIVGRELGIEAETLGRYLAPRRFLERRAATGSPAPAATRAALDVERTQLAADQQWVAERLADLAAPTGIEATTS